MLAFASQNQILLTKQQTLYLSWVFKLAPVLKIWWGLKKAEIILFNQILWINNPIKDSKEYSIFPEQRQFKVRYFIKNKQ